MRKINLLIFKTIFAAGYNFFSDISDFMCIHKDSSRFVKILLSTLEQKEPVK